MWRRWRRPHRAGVAVVVLAFAAALPVVAETTTAEAPARKAGTIKVKLVTPPGVPATVLLRKKQQTVAAAKPAAGKVGRAKLKVAPGTWKPVAEPMLFEDRYYVPTTTPAKATVVAGRTTVVTVRWKYVRTARQLRVTSMTTSSLRMSFVKPGKKAAVRARYAAGNTAPASVRAGRPASISGTTVSANGLSAGQPYSFSLFTRVGKKWLGPVPLTATTRGPAGAQGGSSYIADPATILAPAGANLGSRQIAGGRVVTLLPSGQVPVIGRPVVLPGSAALPGGFVGTISAVGTDGKHVTLTQTALGAAFDYLDVDVPDLSSAQVTKVPARSDPSRTSRAADCGLGGSASVSVDPFYNYDGSRVHVHLVSEDYAWLTVIKGLQVDARLVVNFGASISATVSGGYSCSMDLDPFVLKFNAGPVPMMLRYSPQLEIEASGQGTLANAQLGLTAGITGSVYKPFIGVADVDVKPVVSTSHVMPSASGEGDGSVQVRGRVGGTLSFGPGLGNGDEYGVQAGIQGSVFPMDAKLKATFVDGNPCVEMSVAGTMEVALFAAAWVPQVNLETTFKLFDGSLDYAGPWKAPVPCPTDEPRWVGTITTSESYEQVNTDGRASQTTTYDIAWDGSTFSSTYTDESTNETHPCGTMQHHYSGSGSGPYPTLDLRTVPGTGGGYIGQLFGVDDDHFHDGIRYDEYCTLTPSGYQTVGVSQPSQVVVYPPGHLGCVDTVFPVTKGLHEINGTVTRECPSSGLLQKSTWTYDLRLEPCDLEVDSDLGGIPDCVESAYGLNPADPADD